MKLFHFSSIEEHLALVGGIIFHKEKVLKDGFRVIYIIIKPNIYGVLSVKPVLNALHALSHFEIQFIYLNKEPPPCDFF